MKRLRFTSCMAFLVNGMLAVMTGTIITYLVRDYGISQAAAGRMVAAQSVGNLIMVLLSGFIIQLIGRKKSLLLIFQRATVHWHAIGCNCNEGKRKAGCSAMTSGINSRRTSQHAHPDHPYRHYEY